LPDDRVGRPKTLVKSVVATRGGQTTFARRLVAAAHARGFHAARRKAFVADGAGHVATVRRPPANNIPNNNAANRQRLRPCNPTASQSLHSVHCSGAFHNPGTQTFVATKPS
jgi:hypothetical protein